MNNSSRPIGVFDSGLGGLTAVRELLSILPNEDIVYFGDTGRVPYGTRSVETIKRYTVQDINFLVSQNVKMVIAACGTASSVMTDEMLRILYDNDIIYTGVVSPAAQSAVQCSKTKTIGIIGTNATINSGSYKKLMLEIDSSIEVIANACPLFVPLVENGYTNKDNQVTTLVAQDYLAKFTQNSSLDTLILGCTHYPVIKDIIASIMGESVTLIDPGKQAAIYAKQLLKNYNLLNTSTTNGDVKYFVSDSISSFSENAQQILNEPITGTVEKLDIENY